jgi:hypothetical protein
MAFIWEGQNIYESGPGNKVQPISDEYFWRVTRAGDGEVVAAEKKQWGFPSAEHNPHHSR